jgi:protein-S-isoprenylcysteine O-methyltransferase Ste14
MKRILIFLYGTASYVAFVVSFLYAIGFVGNLAVPKSMDSAATGPWQTALCIDLGLLSLFALQHSIMARPVFKRLLTKLVPDEAERSTFVLAASSALLFLFWQWRPIGGTVWDVQTKAGRWALYSGFAFGWALVLFATFVISHFDLFGLRQVWRQLQGKPRAESRFTTPVLYRVVRHPLYLGFFIAFWCTPKMTITHLFFAIVTTAYVLVAIQLEERDLVAEHPEYASYRKQVPMIVPGIPRKVVIASPDEAEGVAARLKAARETSRVA